jgi:glycosyltransferase involved in cell wall biosynthesis
MQETDFPVEILIHDDASTDGSDIIIRKYADKYPLLFKPIIQTENQFSKGFPISLTFQFPRARGKYIAFCEGDDFWIDPQKLQIQCSFLESHPDYSMTDSYFEVCDDKSTILDNHLYSNFSGNIYDGDILLDLLKNNFILTCTTCCRKEVVTSSPYISQPIHLDYSLFLSAAWHGKVKHFTNKTACYRINPTSLMHTECDFVYNRCNYIRSLFMILWMQDKRFKYPLNDRRKMYESIVKQMYEQLRARTRDKVNATKVIKFIMQYPVLWRYFSKYIINLLKIRFNNTFSHEAN